MMVGKLGSSNAFSLKWKGKGIQLCGFILSALQTGGYLSVTITPWKFSHDATELWNEMRGKSFRRLARRLFFSLDLTSFSLGHRGMSCFQYPEGHSVAMEIVSSSLKPAPIPTKHGSWTPVMKRSTRLGNWRRRAASGVRESWRL